MDDRGGWSPAAPTCWPADALPIETIARSTMNDQEDQHS
jgi:hypothetical protein